MDNSPIQQNALTMDVSNWTVNLKEQIVSSTVNYIL